eukprot:4748-Rhodomonas_salina.3
MPLPSPTILRAPAVPRYGSAMRCPRLETESRAGATRHAALHRIELRQNRVGSIGFVPLARALARCRNETPHPTSPCIPDHNARYVRTTNVRLCARFRGDGSMRQAPKLPQLATLDLFWNERAQPRSGPGTACATALRRRTNADRGHVPSRGPRTVPGALSAYARAMRCEVLSVDLDRTVRAAVRGTERAHGHAATRR